MLLTISQDGAGAPEPQLGNVLSQVTGAICDGSPAIPDHDRFMNLARKSFAAYLAAIGLSVEPTSRFRLALAGSTGHNRFLTATVLEVTEAAHSSVGTVLGWAGAMPPLHPGDFGYHSSWVPETGSLQATVPTTQPEQIDQFMPSSFSPKITGSFSGISGQRGPQWRVNSHRIQSLADGGIAVMTSETPALLVIAGGTTVTLEEWLAIAAPLAARGYCVVRVESPMRYINEKVIADLEQAEVTFRFDTLLAPPSIAAAINAASR